MRVMHKVNVTSTGNSRIIFAYAPDKGKSCPAPFMSKEIQALGDDLYYDLERIQLMQGQFKPDYAGIKLVKKDNSR